MDWMNSLWAWAQAHEAILIWAAVATLVLFIVAPLLVGGLLVLLPSDYFATNHKPLASFSNRPALRMTLLAGKKLWGGLLIFSGRAMLMLPGPGWLTIFAGIVLLDFPGKFRLQRRIVEQPKVCNWINRLRRQAGREPLVLHSPCYPTA